MFHFVCLAVPTRISWSTRSFRLEQATDGYYSIISILEYIHTYICIHPYIHIHTHINSLCDLRRPHRPRCPYFRCPLYFQHAARQRVRELASKTPATPAARTRCHVYIPLILAGARHG